MSSINLNFYWSQLLKQLDLLDSKLLQNGYVQQIHEKTQARPSYLVVGASAFLVLFLVWGVGAKFVTNLIGFAYPLYESYRALSANQHASTQHNQQVESQWLTYWIIFAAFTLVESLTDFFLYWIPLYHLVKIVFLVWCYLPSTRGAQVIYQKVIEPILSKYEGKIDGAGREGKRVANKVIADVANEVAQAELRAAGEGTERQGEQ